MKTNRPDTPCVAICSTALGDDVCKGCARTFAEISQWCFMDEDEKDSVWKKLDDRKKLFSLGKLCGASLIRIIEEEGLEWAELLVVNGACFKASIDDRGYALNFSGQIDVKNHVLSILFNIINNDKINVIS